MKSRALKRELTRDAEILKFPVAKRALTDAKIILLFSILCGAPLIFLRGIGVYDDSLFLKYGEMIARGLLPYRDFIDYKPPLVLYTAALLTKLFGTHWLVPRVFLFLFALGFGDLVVRFLREQFGKTAAWVGAWLFPCSYFIAQGYSFHTELFGAFFGFVAGVLALTVRTRAGYLGAGVACGLAFLCKQPCALYLPAVCLVPFIDCFYGKDRWHTGVERAFLAIVGFALPILLFFALFWENRVDAFNCLFWRALNETRARFSPKHFLLLLKNPGALFGGIALGYLAYTTWKGKKVGDLARKRALVFFGAAGFVSLTISLRANATEHYLMHAMVFTTCFTAIVFGFGPKSHRPMLWAILAVSLLANVAVFAAGIKKWTDGLLAIDLAQKEEIQSVFNSSLLPQDRVLAISELSARSYYLSGRIPAVSRLVFYWRKEFDAPDAWALMREGAIPAALWDLPAQRGTPEYARQVRSLAAEVRARYELRTLEHGWHPLLQQETVLLIKKR